MREERGGAEVSRGGESLCLEVDVGEVVGLKVVDVRALESFEPEMEKHEKSDLVL